MNWSIDGTPIPAPDTDSYSVECNDIDSSQTGRLDNGYLFRERVRMGVYKVSFSWHVNGDWCITLKNLLMSNTNISVTFKDGNSWVTATMYCAKLSKKCISNFGDGLWVVSANCEEV